MIEKIQPPFRDIYKALAFYNYKSPVRAKSVNVLEQEGRSSDVPIPFSGDCPEDIYASVVYSVVEALQLFPNWNMRRAFSLYHLGPRLGKSEIAILLRVSDKTIGRWINKIEDELKREMIFRELIPSENDIET